MKPITPHLWFDKEAKEAAQFYCSVFPLAVEPRTAGEAAYVAELFDYRSVRASW
jgi:predicted 3-demethylubiquinone-9 3-methyltransferase (glyoxalase superfamily)